MKNIEEIIKGCINNDRRSQEIFFKFFYKKMFAVCLSYIGDKDETADVLQDGFIKVFKNLHKFDSSNEAQLFHWIKQIMSNNSIDYLRRNNKRKFSLIRNTTHNIPDDNGENEYLDIIERKTNKILSLIPKLSICYRQVFIMYALENKPHKEIAKILDINEITSRTHYMRAKQKLRKLLEREFAY